MFLQLILSLGNPGFGLRAIATLRNHVWRLNRLSPLLCLRTPCYTDTTLSGLTVEHHVCILRALLTRPRLELRIHVPDLSQG